MCSNFFSRYFPICFLFAGYKDQIYRNGDRLVVVHSHELHPPALPRK